jgi:hypothetical protein
VRLPKNPWVRWPTIVLGSYGLFLCLVMLFENKLIFHPIRYPEGDWSTDGLAVEDAWFQAEDGTKLHGWFVPHPSPKATRRRRRWSCSPTGTAGTSRTAPS